MSLRAFVCAAAMCCFIGVGLTRGAVERERISIDAGWRFALGNAADPVKDFGYGLGRTFAKAGQSTGPVKAAFDDAKWRVVDVPHDWVVELPFDEKADGSHGFHPIGRQYPQNCIGWYRRTLDISKADAGKRISLEFDGVFRDSVAWLNGQYLGRNFSGYTGFRYDITDYVNFGGKNVLVVRVDASEMEGWFYEGAGIYRHTWLVKTGTLHVPQYGTYVMSDEVGEDKAHLTVQTRVQNQSEAAEKFTLVSTIVSADGKAVASAEVGDVSLNPFQEREISQGISVANPALWSIETPTMYRLVTEVKKGDDVVDRYETPFGIRSLKWDANEGFFLNGKRLELKGTCNHQDHAGVGSALPDRLQAYRVERLKEMGSNAYRSSHNDPTPELLDACDRLGMVVMDEHRMAGSSPEILSELRRMILRDRNHPSVVLWSICNEEGSIQGNDLGVRIAKSMMRTVKELDTTRLITAAMNGAWGKGYSPVLDVMGFNYKSQGNMDGYHTAHPNQPVVETEEASTVSTRGIYENDKVRGYVSAYDDNKPRWGATAEDWWTVASSRPWLAGGFVWTGFDYRGEPTPYSWPCINSHFGIMDTCGFAKDDYYYYQAWWSDKPVLHLLPHWNWTGKEGQPIDVRCFTNAEAVELWLNGKSQGRQDVKRNSHAAWKVNYEPGTLLAKAYRDGKEVMTETVATTGAPAAVKLEADRAKLSADGTDVAVVTVRVVDSEGRTVPVADNEVTFEISGPAKIIGVGNGDASSHEPDKATQRKAFNGLCCVIVQTTKEGGEIRLKAKAEGLADGEQLMQSTP